MSQMAAAQVLDTALTLKHLAGYLSDFKEVSYSYAMDVQFPNGDKDHLDGTIYLNTDDKIYYNACVAFTMIYTDNWFYKADHHNKTVMIVDLNKETNGKILRKERDRQLFQKGILTTFLDSFLLKSARIVSYKQEENVCRITLRFPAAANVQTLDLAYNSDTHSMITCSMISLQPWRNTPKGVQSMELKVKFSNYKTITDKSVYNINAFFSCQKRRIELKKYNNYKLSSKI